MLTSTPHTPFFLDGKRGGWQVVEKKEGGRGGKDPAGSRPSVVCQASPPARVTTTPGPGVVSPHNLGRYASGTGRGGLFSSHKGRASNHSGRPRRVSFAATLPTGFQPRVPRASRKNSFSFMACGRCAPRAQLGGKRPEPWAFHPSRPGLETAARNRRSRRPWGRPVCVGSEERGLDQSGFMHAGWEESNMERANRK
jgi:hypothetical protein